MKEAELTPKALFRRRIFEKSLRIYSKVFVWGFVRVNFNPTCIYLIAFI
jgi:hypothetical protein